MEEEKQEQPDNQPEKRSSRGLVFLLVLLFLLNSVGGVYYYFDSNQKAALRKAQKAEIDQLSAEKEKLALEVEKLTGQVKEKAGNETLVKEEVVKLKEQLLKKNQTISSLGGKDVQILRQQIAELQRVKAALQSKIDSATTQGSKIKLLVDSLKTENEILLALNKNLRRALPEQVDSLRKSQELATKKKDSLAKDPSKPRVVIGNSKTNGFRVEVIRKKDRLTVKARKTKVLKVSFQVISELEGQRPIFMVVADSKGQPIKDESAKKTKVFLEGEPKEIVYHGTTKVDFGKGNAAVGFDYNLSEKLLKGTYKFMVYSEDALLGYAEFRLE
jgi:cell division protein FtsB